MKCYALEFVERNILFWGGRVSIWKQNGKKHKIKTVAIICSWCGGATGVWEMSRRGGEKTIYVNSWWLINLVYVFFLVYHLRNNNNKQTKYKADKSGLVRVRCEFSMVCLYSEFDCFDETWSKIASFSTKQTNKRNEIRKNGYKW